MKLVSDSFLVEGNPIMTLTTACRMFILYYGDQDNLRRKKGNRRERRGGGGGFLYQTFNFKVRHAFFQHLRSFLFLPLLPLLLLLSLTKGFMNSIQIDEVKNVSHLTMIVPLVELYILMGLILPFNHGCFVK